MPLNKAWYAQRQYHAAASEECEELAQLPVQGEPTAHFMLCATMPHMGKSSI